MAQTTSTRREALRQTLLDIAEARIAHNGLAALRARDLAQEAGCSVGAIYNVYDDLNGLVMAVNGRTFQALGQAVGNSIKDDDGHSPTDTLIRMSHAYLGFAAENTNLWRALFDLEMSADSDVPDWYMEALNQLFAYIAAPLVQIFPDLDKTDLDLMTRALFSSVHGIVTLGLEKRISGVPLPQIERMIALVLSSLSGK